MIAQPGLFWQKAVLWQLFVLTSLKFYEENETCTHKKLSVVEKNSDANTYICMPHELIKPSPLLCPTNESSP